VKTWWAVSQSECSYRRLVAQGWTDALRALHSDERIYTLWKYFSGTRLPAMPGLRIDHLLLSPSVAGRLVAAGVDRDVRARERSSDHAAGLDRNRGRKRTGSRRPAQRRTKDRSV
jgi:exonuclease III